MPAYGQLDLAHIFNAVNALSADIHRLSEINRLSTIGAQNATKCNVDEAHTLTTSTLSTIQTDQDRHAARVEELWEDVSERINTEDIEMKIDDLLGQIADQPTTDKLEKELDGRITEIDNLVKSEYVRIHFLANRRGLRIASNRQCLMSYRLQNMNVRNQEDVLVRVPRLLGKRLEPVPTKIPYPLTKGELSQLDCELLYNHSILA